MQVLHPIEILLAVIGHAGKHEDHTASQQRDQHLVAQIVASQGEELPNSEQEKIAIGLQRFSAFAITSYDRLLPL
jgi:hypothetical protein